MRAGSCSSTSPHVDDRCGQRVDNIGGDRELAAPTTARGRTVTGPTSPHEDPTTMWIRLDDSLLTDPRFLALTVEERAGAMAVLLAGARTVPPGTWPDADTLAQSLPRWVPDSTVGSMLRSGMLVDVGHIAVPDPLYGPLTPAERATSYRRRHGTITAPSRPRHEPSFSSSLDVDVDVDVRRGVAPHVAGAREAAPDEEDWYTAALLVEELTQRPYALPDPFAPLGEMVRRMLTKHGPERVSDAMRRAATAAGIMPTANQVVLGAGNILDAIPRTRPDCEGCYNMGVNAKGRRPCPDCGRSEPDRRAN